MPILRRRRGDVEIVNVDVIRAINRTLRRIGRVPEVLLGLTLLVKTLFFAPTRRSASGAQPYVRLCVYSGSLLTRSQWNINSSC